jgi:cutinase
MRWNHRRRASAAFAATTLAAVIISVTAVEAQAVPSTAKCANVVVIGARGTLEPTGMGSTAATASSVAARTAKTVRTMALVYPAAAVGYGGSVDAGERALQQVIASLVSSCPSTRIVLVGYSQGAHVIGNLLDPWWPIQLSVTQKSRIAAVVFYGDPTFRAGDSFNTGTGATTGRSGLFARSFGDLSSVATKIRSYCIAGDWACQALLQDQTSVSIHQSYSSRYSYTAATFILGKI